MRVVGGATVKSRQCNVESQAVRVTKERRLEQEKSRVEFALVKGKIWFISLPLEKTKVTANISTVSPTYPQIVPGEFMNE